MASRQKASPGLKAGRGLKHPERHRSQPRQRASPGLKAGRGLKRQVRDRFTRLIGALRPASKPGAD